MAAMTQMKMIAFISAPPNFCAEVASGCMCQGKEEESCVRGMWGRGEVTSGNYWAAGQGLSARQTRTFAFSLYAAEAMKTVEEEDAPVGLSTRTRKTVTAMQMLTGQATPVISSPRSSSTDLSGS